MLRHTIARVLHPARLIRALLLFAAGAVLSWWLTSAPAAPPRHETSTVRPDADAAASVASAASGSALPLPASREPAAGLPPENATAPDAAPDAGRARALKRAVERLETDPPATDAAGVDDETAARVAAGLRARLIERGASR